MYNIEKTLSNFLEKCDIKNQKVMLGFSAGPDSCALALCFARLKKQFALDITLCYFNHGWRNEAACEEEFTQDFAKKFGFEYAIGKMPSKCAKTEEVARDKRYDFFEKTAKKLNCSCVFLAHNKNDNVETIVYRLIKGTSIKGLRAIQAKRDIYYRPFLDIEKDDILKYLKSNKQNYMKDLSNDDVKYRRNYVRKKILPLFCEVNQNYLNAINNFAYMCTLAQHIIDNKMDELEEAIIQDGVIQKPEYVLLSDAYRYELLNNYLGDRLKYRDFKTIKKLDDFILNNVTSQTSLNSKEFLKVRKDKIYIGSTIKYDR